jgi:conjugal transfer pilus assembly protein TraF
MRNLIFALLIINFPLHAGWLERKAEGWAWYEEESKEECVINEEQEEISAVKQLEIIKKNLELLFAEALLDPSHENLVKYMETQKEWVEKSADFSGRWGRVLLERPDLDPTATNFATTHYGRRLQKVLEHENKERLIRSVAKKYGIFFFYEGGNKSSTAFGQVVRAFADKYHWTLVGISMDGISIANMKNEVNPELSKKLGIHIFPALLAFEPKSQTMIPLAFGLKSLDQIENNVFVQFKEAME